MSEPSASTSFEESVELVVDYRAVDDVEAAMREPGTEPSGDPKQSGWTITVSGRKIITTGDRYAPLGEWGEVIAGAVPAPFVNTVAVAIELMREHLPDFFADAVHTVDGSRAAFEQQFDGAFDTRVGAPELA